MHISEPGLVWAKQPADKICIMTGILTLVILKKETGSFIGIQDPEEHNRAFKSGTCRSVNS